MLLAALIAGLLYAGSVELAEWHQHDSFSDEIHCDFCGHFSATDVPVSSVVLPYQSQITKVVQFDQVSEVVDWFPSKPARGPPVILC